MSGSFVGRRVPAATLKVRREPLRLPLLLLIPWSLLEFLHGNTTSGIGFLILYAVAALTRQTLEPRLVGQQIGLPPVVTLFALYAGYKTIGVPGMILFPISAVLLKQLWDHSGLQKS